MCCPRKVGKKQNRSSIDETFISSRRARQSLQRSEDLGKILIANIPHDIDEAELTNWLQQSGSRVKEIHLIRDEVSRSSASFAHVEVDEDSVPDLINRLNGKILRRRSIAVSENKLALPRS
jgi:hypothetical protein